MVGEAVTLAATVNPSNATQRNNLSWDTSDFGVAGVSEGVVTARNAGIATITASAEGKSASCKVTVTAQPDTTLTLDKYSLYLKVGETDAIKATVNPGDASGKTVMWTTSDSSVATVNGGVVTAKKIGFATITAKKGSKIAYCAVFVKTTPVESITLNKTSVSLLAGETATLTATVNPEDATDKTVSWNSSDDTIASVHNGVVTANKVGSVLIVASSGDKSATCQVAVEKTPFISIILDKTSVTLKEGETTTLSATVSSENVSDKTVTWKSSDISVATVKDGLVKAVKIGIATISAKVGDKIATCQVIVEAVPVALITLDKSYLTLKAGETAHLLATVTPENATDKTVYWSTSDASVATVKNGLVTGVRSGSAIITAASGDKSATCDVFVPEPTTGVILDQGELTISVGSSAILVATVLPTNATNKKVNWISSDNSIATIDNGKVKAIMTGRCTITVTTVDGGFKATCAVKVKGGLDPDIGDWESGGSHEGDAE